MESRERVDPRELPPVITPEDLSRVTGQHPTSIRKQCRDGTIPARRIGKLWYMNRDAVLGNLVPQPLVVDERAMRMVLDAARKAVEAGKAVTIGLEGSNAT